MMERNMETTVVCWRSIGICGGIWWSPVGADGLRQLALRFQKKSWWSLFCGGQGSVCMGNASLGRTMLFSVACILRKSLYHAKDGAVVHNARPT